MLANAEDSTVILGIVARNWYDADLASITSLDIIEPYKREAQHLHHLKIIGHADWD